MKTLPVLLILLCGCLTAQAQKPSWEELAKSIVHSTASIQPGDMVYVEGGKHTLPLMEEITAEIFRVGGHPIMAIHSDNSLRAMISEMPDDQVVNWYKNYLKTLKEFDVIITLPQSENFEEVYKDIPEQRFALMTQNQPEIIKILENEMYFSQVFVNYPTKQDADSYNISFTELEKIHWKGMNADPKKMAAVAKNIHDALANANKVVLTTPSGTNLTFSMNDRRPYGDDGQLTMQEKKSDEAYIRYASLPGGYLDFAPVESTVNGKVVIDKARCNYETMTAVTFNVVDGKFQEFNADKGKECFLNDLAAYDDSDKTLISMFSLGINPKMYVLNEGSSEYRPVRASGHMSLYIGRNNTLLGGNVESSFNYGMPLTNVTLVADGKTIVKDGKIILEKNQ